MTGLSMDTEIFNIQIRRFLKKVGINSQREIEQAVLREIKSGSLDSESQLQAEMVLRIPAVNLEIKIEDKINLS
tara:strand:- start:1805 stop:2026 length:222 start_codon:yes stop_codon:yes gene_type:complete